MRQVPKGITVEGAKAELCRRSFFYFLKTFWHVVIPEDPIYNWHIPYLCNELQEVVERVVDRKEKLHDVIINIPPGTTKSTICTVMLPVWAWIRDPRIRTLTGSYSASLAVDHSTKSRDIIKSQEFKALFPDIEIRRDFDNKSHYKNSQGGERLAAGIGGSLTGFHAHLIIIDDPLNPKEAASDADRTTANEFMKTTLSTRKIDKAVTPTILVMQRLHMEDPTGDILTRNKANPDAVYHICLPGEISERVRPEELAERYIDGLLDPIRLNRSILEKLQTDLGSYGYAGQIGQSPTPLDGGIWQPWVQAIEDARIDELKEQASKMGTDWDLAYTKNDTNSASAFVTAFRYGENMYIDRIGWQWYEFPQLIRYMTSQQEPHYIEAKASGKSAKQTLANAGINAVEVDVKGGADKIARTTMATPYAEAGRVYCRKSILDRLLNDEKQGILHFPNSGTDLNDALTQSIFRLLGTSPGFFF